VPAALAPTKLVAPQSPSPQKGDKGLYTFPGTESLGEGSSSGGGRVGRVLRGRKSSTEAGPYAAPVTPQNPSRRIRSQGKGEMVEDTPIDAPLGTPSPVAAIVTPPNATNSLSDISPISITNDPMRIGMSVQRGMLFETPRMTRPMLIEDPTPPPMLKTMYGTERAGDNRFADPNEWPPRRRW